MNYYQINWNGGEPKVVGVSNGVFQVEINKKEILNDSRYNNFFEIFRYHDEFWNNQNKIYNLNVPLILGKLAKNAKITDVMGYTQGIVYLKDLYSKNYIEIIKDFNIHQYKIFEVGIENVNDPYFLLFIETIRMKDIKYDESIIYTGHKIRNNVKYYEIRNFKEYEEFQAILPINSFETVCISNNYFGRDIISIQGIGGSFYSERLIETLLKKNMTGLKINYENSTRLKFY